MRIAFSLPFTHADGSSYDGAEVMNIARKIEDAGFDGIWLGDALGRRLAARPDPLMWLLTAALATSRIEVGTAVLQTPLRRPVDLAQRLLTMHALTRGRFVAGLGAGSTKTDFDASEVDYASRFKTLSSDLTIIRGLMRGEQVGEANLLPWPNTIPGPPIMIGSWVSGIWVKRAAQEFDGWLTSGSGPGGTTFRNLIEGIKIYRDEGGKRAIVATVGTDLTENSPHMTDDDRFSLRCSPDEAVDRLLRVAALGYDDVLLRNDNMTEQDILEVADVVARVRKELA